MVQATNLNPATAKCLSKVQATRMPARFMIAKLVASTADSLCMSLRRKYAYDSSRSRKSHGRSLRCPAHKGIVVNAVVIAGRTLGLAVPERHGTYRIGLENDLSDCVADDLGDAAARARSGLAQGVEFFLAKINLRFSMYVTLVHRVTYVKKKACPGAPSRCPLP